MHKLQFKKNLGWDEELSNEFCKEWQNIVKQANAIPSISISRVVGSGKSSYKLIAFSDSSKDMYSIVVYIINLQIRKSSFLMAKNRIIIMQLKGKSIPL